MRKSEVVTMKLSQAEAAIERAIKLVQEVSQLDENGDGSSIGDFMSVANIALDEIAEIGYEVAMPMQMDEEAREQEIASLEARLAQLRAQ